MNAQEPRQQGNRLSRVHVPEYIWKAACSPAPRRSRNRGLGGDQSARRAGQRQRPGHRPDRRRAGELQHRDPGQDGIAERDAEYPGRPSRRRASRSVVPGQDDPGGAAVAVAEAARSVGWGDLDYATRCFHAAYGMSPTYCRRRQTPVG